jgi:hypothetical protein
VVHRQAVTRPIEELAGIAQAVTAGDLHRPPAIDRSDEVGILGRSFAKMITSLRDKAELEELYEQMAAKSQEREAERSASSRRELDEGTVLVTDLRGLPATVGDGDATNVIAAVSEVMKLQEAEVARQDGYRARDHRTPSGQRFPRRPRRPPRHPRRPRHQRGAGVECGDREHDPSASASPRGSSSPARSSLKEETMASPSSATRRCWPIALRLARADRLRVLSYETAQAAGGEIISTATREQVQLKWIPQPLPVASLPLVSLTTA